MPGTVEAFFLTDLILSKSLGVGTIPILQMRRQAQRGEVICLQSLITGKSQESECLPLRGENSALGDTVRGGDPNPALLWELLVWVAGRVWRATWSCDIAGSPLWGWQACPGILLVDGANCYQVLSPPGSRPSDKHLLEVCLLALFCPVGSGLC